MPYALDVPALKVDHGNAFFHPRGIGGGGVILRGRDEAAIIELL
jgi:hypothetical protein